MKQFLALTLFISTAYGWCYPWQSSGTINVCKQEGKQDCRGVSSGDTCVNLNGGPFVSGFAGQSEACKIFSDVDCKGTSNPVDQSGWNKFAFAARSIECPCV
ncbi:hypothetical protein H4219_000788 [Mycoemilia scoparia]|uniref:Uncharacterized protein n=1 Tax=Mycoemilia scoparia TaxID=417184 RepID=A0A9W8A9V6_9FUNG|nr:hypothetical protein H4219_000788 [Mycoemilia scoparia]